jgi:pilus assembly protein Flp/PilA
MDGRCAIDGKFSVPYHSGAHFFVRLKQSFSLFLKAASTVPTYSLTNMARDHPGSVDRSLSMRRLLARFVDDERGATAIEYCLIATGISIAIISAVNGIGSALNPKFNDISSSLK